ncbi:F0F1 ATP synthase subunit epsilon [Blattabacterium sp. (Periplaneta americana) str. BPLAN]|uniref:F0F1 ATP synthase subunit epsilon n=1 Tax=Blattabacterium sp. (Periplaneta americana) TaxID=367488 RepID=UPI0001BA0D08|nr:F0F1 ATP synthase subunit epsilon [Blattabacterium sp. (Periplaneta americana)]ACX84163.1 F0F1 ATP synthase subunit epsilon [Blattabacterium sp. (Periplaneta americana) str. BPLAN]
MQVTIINFEKIFYQDKVVSIVAPGLNGYFQILENHAPFISILKDGILKLKPFYVYDRKNFEIQIEGGILQVKKNMVSIIL